MIPFSGRLVERRGGRDMLRASLHIHTRTTHTLGICVSLSVTCALPVDGYGREKWKVGAGLEDRWIFYFFFLFASRLRLGISKEKAATPTF